MTAERPLHWELEQSPQDPVPLPPEQLLCLSPSAVRAMSGLTFPSPLPPVYPEPLVMYPKIQGYYRNLPSGREASLVCGSSLLSSFWWWEDSLLLHGRSSAIQPPAWSTVPAAPSADSRVDFLGCHLLADVCTPASAPAPLQKQPRVSWSPPHSSGPPLKVQSRLILSFALAWCLVYNEVFN